MATLATLLPLTTDVNPYSTKRNSSQPGSRTDQKARSSRLVTTFRLVSNPVYAVLSQFVSFGLVWLLFRDWKFALVLWVGLRLFALWANLIQNYWTHDRRFGTRRYDDAQDNAMNIGDWLPVMATFSACLQNNHHHYPRFLRTSHDPSEFDFGFMTVRVMKSLGLVKASSTGADMPADLALRELGF